MKLAIIIICLGLIVTCVFIKSETFVDKEHFELAAPMGKMQVFMDKLYFSGKSSNWELVNFYLHEIEEQVEKIVDAKIVEDDLQISVLAASHLDPKIKSLEAATSLENNDRFLKEYDILVNNCNECHVATKHGFIKITVPVESMFHNQDYSKVASESTAQ
jgi:hypothetical protein